MASKIHPSRRARPHAPHRRRHTLSAGLTAVVVLWLGLYVVSDPGTHLGAFFGNGIADWLGVLVFVVATKNFGIPSPSC